MDKLRLVQTLLSVAGISSGQMLLKLGALNLHNPKAMGLWVGGLCINVHLMAGITLLGLSTMLWIWVLRVVPLGIAYPFMALAFLIVPILAASMLGEPFGWKNVMGGVLIVTGVAFVAG